VALTTIATKQVEVSLAAAKERTSSASVANLETLRTYPYIYLYIAPSLRSEEAWRGVRESS
jgi:hypothetical protein